MAVGAEFRTIFSVISNTAVVFAKLSRLSTPYLSKGFYVGVLMPECQGTSLWRVMGNSFGHGDAVHAGVARGVGDESSRHRRVLPSLVFLLNEKIVDVTVFHPLICVFKYTHTPSSDIR